MTYYCCSNGTEKTEIGVQEIIDRMKQYAQNHQTIRVPRGKRSTRLSRTCASIVVSWRDTDNYLSLHAVENFLNNNQQVIICRGNLEIYNIEGCSVMNLYALLQEMHVGFWDPKRIERCTYSFEFYQKEDT